MLPVFALILIVKHLLLTGALAEEIGWRGYLLPKLVDALGPRWALPLSGLMHGIWHLPIIILTPLYHADGNWLIVLPMFLVGATVSGMVEGHLRLMTNSVWPPAIMHAAHNVFWNLFALAAIASPEVAEYVVGESGVLPVLGYAVALLAVVLIARRGSRRSRLATA
jgi:membrane protease YdiL (CAAX protease family)